ncbi:CPBP family intramembrane metalloprotease [Paenibacillus polymyxa]|uniref:CPBP family intramembrane glutamic endopeptidase n=1 Tax=Paenibacillus polymyxa TaxID=1406 RepID=UPI001BE7982E|nr:CPBP family intramembrane glutamic endopeptidase [Paenibacillus polymyxa]MBT2286084.1 CPBP family intramembrane metalloprotease [Paenibacillus polymyxa]
MNKKRFNLVPILLITIMVVVCAPLLLWFRSSSLLTLNVFENAVYNLEISFQITVLLLAFIVIGIVYGVTGKDGLAYLNLKKRDGKIRPETWIGIKPKETETWRNLGVNFAIVITLVTSVVVYFQVVHGGNVSLELYPGVILILIFALMNAFSEEIIFRFSFVAVVSKNGLSPYVAQGLAASIFGVVHYFGNPGGIPGVLMAAFIGWFLAKSMLETKGFFWALTIHFLQDVVIFSALFMQ